jgi:hypothetical protein
MEIKYTYKEPEDRPIKSAEFKPSHGAPMEMGLVPSDNQIVYLHLQANEYGIPTVNFNKQDFADFTALVNRINRQINGGA